MEVSHTKEYKGCVIIQGPTYKSNLEFIRRCWYGYKLVFSTWEGTDLGDFLQHETVILNKIPEYKGVLNVNLQRVSTLSGLKHAKHLGWKRVFKWRCDMIHYGPEFISMFDPNALNVYSWCHNFGGHITDYFFEGEVDDLLNIYDFDLKGPFPEHMITKKLYESGLNQKVNCVGDKFGYSGDVFWYGNGNDRDSFWLSSNRSRKDVFDFTIPNDWNEELFDKQVKG
jgi:hypothetical protein